MQNSTKNKIYFAIFIWLLISFLMFGWVFKRMNASNKSLLDTLMTLKIDEAKLQAEKASFIAAQKDLERLSLQKIQPETFFSQDVTLVNELRRLESIAADLGITMNLGGISGTLKTAAKAKTKSQIFQIPYSIGLVGPLAKVVSFMEYLENLEYINTVSMVNISGSDQENISANFTAAFYLKK